MGLMFRLFIASKNSLNRNSLLYYNIPLFHIPVIMKPRRLNLFSLYGFMERKNSG